MYNTFREVVEATLKKYENVEKLSKGKYVFDAGGTVPKDEHGLPKAEPASDARGCYYRHDMNGIGCAIGCHFSADEARELDKIGYAKGGGFIQYMPHNDRARAIILQRFSPSIDIMDLARLQGWHDSSQTVDQFVARMESYLKSGEASA